MGNTVSRLFGAKDSKSSKSNTPNGQQTTAAAQSTTAMAATTTTTKSSSPSTSVVNPIGQDVIDSVEKHGYLFGLKLAKSLSPLLHSTIYRGIGLDYGNYRLESDDISLFLELIKHPKFYGASVTMPNKVAILPHLDDLTPECRDVGACNTVYFRTEPSTGARLLCGTNTDTVGVRESFLRNVPSPDATFYDRPALVVGGGGAARSAVYALRKWLRVRDIYLVNRDDGEVQAVLDECASRGYGEGLRHVKTVAEAQALEGVGAVVACVPDFPPVTDAEKTARAIVETFLGKEHKGAMLEMCYNPTPYTEIWALGEKNGWQVILGTEAMIWQGFEQHRYWDDIEVEKLPIKEVQEVIANALAKPPSSKL